MDNAFILVTTPVQAKFHLLNREVIFFDTKDAKCYMTYVKGKVRISIQPTFGSATVMMGALDKLDSTMQYMGDNKVEFYVFKGGTLSSRPNNILDKFADFVRDKLEKNDDLI